jgi:ubiquinone/menaquinone biosynthesis C-methylase UbiE
MSLFDYIAPWYEHLHRGSKRTADTLKKIADVSPTDTLVDIGGGTGRIAKYFVGDVREIIVIDPSTEMLKQCRARTGLTCLLGSADGIPLPDASADSILMVDAFHHFSNQPGAITEAIRILRPGGSIIFHEFDPGTAIGGLIMTLEKIAHFGSTFHSPASLMALLITYGLTTETYPGSRGTYTLIAHRE